MHATVKFDLSVTDGLKGTQPRTRTTGVGTESNENVLGGCEYVRSNGSHSHVSEDRGNVEGDLEPGAAFRRHT